MVQQKNRGTIQDCVLENGRFKYCYFAFGALVHGFRFCRPVICVDGSFLKSKFGGQLLVAVALDANSQLFPIAFAIVDSENNSSWTYFMQKLRETIGSVPELAIVSDRHASIANALRLVFPDAHHGACYHHITMNVVAKFKTDACHKEIHAAAYAYRKSEFLRCFANIRTMNPAIAGYLEGIGIEKWARSHFPGF